MDPYPLLDRVLDDEGLTAGLDEPEASVLIRAVTDRVRLLATRTDDAEQARQLTESVCRQARQIAQVAVAFRDQGEPAARALAATHHLRWPPGAATAGDVVRRMVGALDRPAD
jgi:hypothetical protein